MMPILFDCTLRDTGYVIDFQFDTTDTERTVRGLSDAGLRFVEVGHGLGLGASRAGYLKPYLTDGECVEVARTVKNSNTKVSSFLIPGIGSTDDLKYFVDTGGEVIRFGVEKDKINDCTQYIDLANKLGLDVFINLMKSHNFSKFDLDEVMSIAVDHKSAGIYIVDSAGCMTPTQISEFVGYLKELSASMAVGFHGHDNLGLVHGNILAAIHAGVDFVDTTLMGKGRGGGNASTELCALLLRKFFEHNNLDIKYIFNTSYNLNNRYNLVDASYWENLLMGYAHLHSSFFPRVKDLCGECKITVLDYLIYLGDNNLNISSVSEIEKFLHEFHSNLKK